MGRKRSRRTDEERKKDKEQKLLQKMIETPEEKRRRRLEKKARKQRRRERRGEAVDGANPLGYTNADNPFNDTRLTEKFVWKAKREQLRKSGVNPDDYDEDRELRRREELHEELEKAKQRREQREREKKEREEERERERAEKEREAYADWEQKEHEFHLDQARRRSEIRIEEGRPKPIDILYKNLKMLDDDVGEDEGLDIEIEEPYHMFSDLTVAQLRELKEDIEMYTELDTSHAEFWRSLNTVCVDELAMARANAADGGGTPAGDVLETAMHGSVAEDVLTTFAEKTHAELEKLHDDVIAQIEQDNAVDSEYWEALDAKLVVFKAKAYLHETHAELLQRKLQQLEARGITPTPTTTSTSADAVQHNGGASDGPSSSSSVGSREKAMYDMEAGQKMADNEEAFDLEFALEDQVYWWQDKYRPRKPTYFNRVHTGYDWNRYNRAHYDSDAPPPKIVQGYKFNIFYPDLIDPSVPPRYIIEKAESPDIAIIRFHAGPPYEDVAFKVVNREWEYSHKKGFKCVFDRGILHLWFNFRRYRYRR